MAPLSRVVLVWIAVGIAMATVLVVVVLWWAGTRGLNGPELVTARLDALRTGLSIGLGGGGLFALYLAWRRQRSTEIGLAQKQEDQLAVARAYELQERTTTRTHELQERAAQASEADAAARRITDLYTKAIELLGNDQAPVRLGGLYALERLAQDNPDQRPTITSVLCAYLRMPFPPLSQLDDDASDDQRAKHDDQLRAHNEQQQVRDTALDIIHRHRRRSLANDPLYWEYIPINLTGANLTAVNLSGANLTGANFSRANLSHANLAHADLTGADLTDTNLTGANLKHTELTDAYVTGANLTYAHLIHANLTGAHVVRANLTGAHLTRANLTHANLTRADLTRADLTDTNLTRANLSRADLTGANLTHATLPDAVDYTAVRPKSSK